MNADQNDFKERGEKRGLQSEGELLFGIRDTNKLLLEKDVKLRLVVAHEIIVVWMDRIDDFNHFVFGLCVCVCDEFGKF